MYEILIFWFRSLNGEVQHHVTVHNTRRKTTPTRAPEPTAVLCCVVLRRAVPCRAVVCKGWPDTCSVKVR